MDILQIVATAFLFTCSARAAVSPSGVTVSLGQVDYFLPPKVVAKIDGCNEIKSQLEADTLLPFTVVPEGQTVDSSISSYSSDDDVWQEAFLEAVYSHGGIAPTNISSIVLSGKASSKLAPGPYFMNSAGHVYEAWRLFSDVQGAFTEPIIGNGDNTYSVLPANTVGQKHAIAVPSRLYYIKTPERPLAGVRIGIKDIYDIKGLRTSNGNRAWYWLYPPANDTAPPVQNLIDAGAILVGKMVTSQFANGEVATADWVSYHSPFNPRGDGYQDTASSSAGGGAGAAAYPWLDITLGSDTGGSVRGPAQSQGVYGNRPTTGLVSLARTMSLSPTLDTPGLLARNPTIWRQAAQAIYGTNVTLSNAYPTSIKTLGWPTLTEDPASELLIQFLGNVSTFLGANSSAFNISASFDAANPDVAPFESFMNLTYTTLITKEQIPLVRDPFYADYATKYDGRKPFVDPVPLARWDWADSSSVTIEEARTNKTIFMSWANETLLAPSIKTCSESLVMYVGLYGTLYRNVYLDDPVPPFGWYDVEISVFAEVPDIVVPIGQAPYNSTVTGHIEYLPVTANFMAAKGCDGMLFSLVEDLYAAGYLKDSLAGRSAVSGGDILFRRES